VVALQTKKFTDYAAANSEIEILNSQLSIYNDQLSYVPIIVICDDSGFVSKTLNNFLWVTFTRCNPSHE